MFNCVLSGWFAKSESFLWENNWWFLLYDCIIFLKCHKWTNAQKAFFLIERKVASWLSIKSILLHCYNGYLNLNFHPTKWQTITYWLFLESGLCETENFQFERSHITLWNDCQIDNYVVLFSILLRLKTFLWTQWWMAPYELHVIFITLLFPFID